MGDEFKNLFWMNLHVNRSKHQKYFWEPGALLMLKMNCFNKYTKSNCSSERLDHTSLAKSAQYDIQTNKKRNKQTEYQNVKV